MPETIVLPDDYVGVAARATSVLTPVWTQPIADATYGARASGGQVWFATRQGEAIAVRRVDEQGATVQETLLSVPAVPNTTVQSHFSGFTAHARGPVLNVQWTYLAAPGLDCEGQPWSQNSRGSFTAQNGILVCPGPGTGGEVVVFDSENLAAPRRFNPCSGVAACFATGDAYRSGDGETVLFATLETLVEKTLDGKVVTQQDVPRLFHALPGTAVDEKRWVLYGAGGTDEGLPGGRRGLVTFERGGKPEVTYLEGADVAGAGTGNGLVLPGPGRGQSIAVVERRTASTPHGGSYEQPGDIAVLWLEAGALKSQQVLARQDYANLPLVGAGVDDVGTAYIVTSTGDRSAVLNHTLTTLVCRFPVASEGKCFELPTPDQPDARLVKGIYALRENVLLVNTGTQLARVDLPL